MIIWLVNKRYFIYATHYSSASTREEAKTIDVDHYDYIQCIYAMLYNECVYGAV